MSEEGVERRLTTILAADVVGYSRLMAADEAGTLASLKAIRRELIEPKTVEYHGRVVKLMGDGTLMEFGSVVDAVNFAVDAQRVMAERIAKVPEDRRITYCIQGKDLESLTTLREKLVKIGAKVVRHGRYITFQMAEVAIPRTLFVEILRLIDGLRPAPLPP